MLITWIIENLNSADANLRNEAQVSAALALELSQISGERRAWRLKEFELIGLGPESAIEFKLETMQVKSIIDGLCANLRRFGEGSAIWALGKAQPDLVVERVLEILGESLGSIGEETAWQYGCVFQVWLELKHVKPERLGTIRQFLDRIQELKSDRLLELGSKLDRYLTV